MDSTQVAEGPTAHVPYYDSKLTTLLRPAFGGNSKTAVLVTCSPDDRDGDEALASLRFGARCARVTNACGAATADMADVLAHLDAQIAGTRATLAALEAGGAKARAAGEAGNAALRVESHHWFCGTPRILRNSLPQSNRTRFARFLDRSSSKAPPPPPTPHHHPKIRSRTLKLKVS